MKKNNLLLLSLLFLGVVGCNNQTESSSMNSSSSSITLSESSTSSSTYKVVDVKFRDLELELNDEGTAYYITKYKKFEKNIRFSIKKLA